MYFLFSILFYFIPFYSISVFNQLPKFKIIYIINPFWIIKLIKMNISYFYYFSIILLILKFIETNESEKNDEFISL